jgi:hypothetical protein
MSDGGLAEMVAGWVRDAIKDGLLLLSNPPFNGKMEGYAVGTVVTHTFDKSGTLVGKRWGQGQRSGDRGQEARTPR